MSDCGSFPRRMKPTTDLDPPLKLDRPDPMQVATWARLSPEQKLEIGRQLRQDVLSLKRAWVREQNPHISEKIIEARLRAWQLYGRTDLD